MTTDPFTTAAAREYAESACYQDENRPIAEAGFLAGCRAVRSYLAAQEEVDAERDARVLFEWDTEDHPEPKPTWDGLTGEQKDVWRSAITALSAARRARGGTT